MNRRQFIIGSFMAGVLAAVGIKPETRRILVIEGESRYLKCASFHLGEPTTVYLVGHQVTWGEAKVLPGISGNYAITVGPAPSRCNSVPIFSTTGRPFNTPAPYLRHPICCLNPA